MDERFRLNGECALVSGGSKGLGFSVGRAISRAGASVVLTSRHLEEAAEGAASIEAEGGVAIAVKADVTSREEIAACVQLAEQKFGKIDILLNNAGINIRRPTLELEEADWDPVIDTNLKGCLICAQAVRAGMISRKYGRIINLGSLISSTSLGG